MNLLKSWPCKLVLIVVLSLIASLALAANSFIIKNIRFEGLHRITEATALSYIPVQVGQRYTTQVGNRTLQALYQTQFFSDVRLSRHRRTLLIWVTERPTIGLISIKGNKSVPKKALKKVLQHLDIVEGSVFQQANLHEIVQGLMQEYAMMGRYAASVQAHIKHLPRNRVAIYIHIDEGKVAKVRKITIIGNHAFSERDVVDTFKLTTPGLFTILTHTDRYSKFKLAQSLQSLQLFYLNHGYLRFQIVSKHVNIIPGKGVYITVHIYEGAQYHISGFKVVGKHIDKAKIESLIHLHAGMVFSRRLVLAANDRVAHLFADNGYAFPDIRMVPTINDNNRSVFLTFYVKKGRIIYIRHINFVGNHRTDDNVLRFQMRQMEGGKFNLKEIDESKRRLANLPFLRHIQVVPQAVPGHPNEADLNFHFKEINAGKISVQAGLSEDGLLYGASISEPNFMGTGHYVALSFQRSSYSTNYQFEYNNPFYTIYGMSRGFNFYITQSNTKGRKKIKIENSYNMNDYGAQMFYGLPITQYMRLNFGYGYDYIKVFKVNTATVSPDVRVFLQNFGFNPASPKPVGFHQFSGNMGLTRVTLNRAVFPTDGSIQKLTLTVAAPISSRSPGFAKMTFTGHWFIPLGHGFVINPHTQLGYGTGFGKSRLMPFWENFFAGGINTMPGFSANSLGPQNAIDGVSMGGNVELLAGVNFIFPNFISDKLRTAFIINAGNIFQTNRVQYSAAQFAAAKGKLKPINYQRVSLSNMLVSAGLMVSWYSPLGPLNFSIAFPIVKGSTRTSVIGFSFGTGL